MVSEFILISLWQKKITQKWKTQTHLSILRVKKKKFTKNQLKSGLWCQLSLSSLHPPFTNLYRDIYILLWDSPCAFPSGKQSQLSQPFLIRETLQSAKSSSWPFVGPFLVCPRLSWTWESGTGYSTPSVASQLPSRAERKDHSLPLTCWQYLT